MDRKLAAGLASAALIMVAGCHKSAGSAPTGQVIATVDGQEVTQRELQSELNGFSSSDEAATKRAQNAALQSIINRKILAKAGRDAGIEKSAEFQLIKQRNEDMALATGYEQQIASKLPRPTVDETRQYMAQHPNTFAQRKIYVVDRIQIPPNTSPKVLNAIKPLHNMDDIEQVLLNGGVDYVRAPASIDARNSPPAIIDQIAKMPPSEPFVLAGNDAITISQIKETRTVPFSGPSAEEFAQRAILAERASKAIAARVAELQKSGGGAQYQKGYGPPAANPQPKQP